MLLLKFMQKLYVLKNFRDQNDDDFSDDIDDVPRFIKKISEMKIYFMVILKFMQKINFL